MQLALPSGTALRQNCSLPVMLLLELGFGVWAFAETTEAATRAELTIIAFIGYLSLGKNRRLGKTHNWTNCSRWFGKSKWISPSKWPVIATRRNPANCRAPITRVLSVFANAFLSPNSWECDNICATSSPNCDLARSHH